jgi:hypothetical protein
VPVILFILLSRAGRFVQVIALISVLNGMTKMSGKGVCPTDEFLEGLAGKAFAMVRRFAE